MKKLLGLILALCMVFSLCACGGNGSSETAPAAESAAAPAEAPAAEAAAAPAEAPAEGEAPASDAKDELIVGTTNDVTVAFENFDNNNIIGIGLCYDYIVYMDQDTGDLVSDVLEDWYMEDPTTLVMKIKPGVTFTNGEELKGEDVVYSFKGRIDAGIAQIEVAMNFDWDNAEISDDGLTVTVKTFDEYAPGISVLNKWPLESKVQHDTYGLDDEIWWTTTCGTGPYKLVEQVDGAYATYTFRDDYWGDEQYMFKTVTVKHYGDETALYTDFVNGKVDIAMNLGAYSFSQLQGVDGIAVMEQTQGNYIYLGGNYKRDLWNDINFRLALSHAIDWDTLNITGYDGLGAVMQSIFPSNCVGFEPQDVNAYDPELAKDYLAKSSYDGSVLSLVGRDRYSAAAEAVQAMLTEIGVKSEVNCLEFANYLEKMGTDDYDLLMADFNTDNSGEPSNVYSSVGSDSHTASQLIMDEEWNTLKAACNTVDQDARVEALKALQEYAAENCIFIPLMDRYEVWAYNTSVLPADYNCYYGGYTIFAVPAA